MPIVDIKDATITIQDGTTGTPLSVVVKIGEGTFTFSEKTNIEYVRNKGQLDTVREGDEVPVDVSFSANWEKYLGITSASSTAGFLPDVTIVDALKGEGGAAAWKSTDADTCAKYAVDIIIVIDANCVGGTTETYTFADFRLEDLGGDLKAGTFSISGKCNITAPSVIREIDVVP